MAAIALAGKPIAITGASSGIGAATAVACARAGMPVAIAARRVDKLEETAARVREAAGPGHPVLAVRVDVASAEESAAFIDRAAREFGSLYAVYANAGYGLEAPVHEMTDAAMREIFEVNFFGTLNTIRPAIVHMKRAGEGHVLLCASCLAKLPVPFYSAYSATKSAQSHVGRAMAFELGPLGIHTSTVHPIGTKTEFFERVERRNGGARLVAHTRDAMMQPPERVADATVAALRRPRLEVWPGAAAVAVRLGMAVCTAFPGIEGMWMRKMVRDRTANRPAGAAEEAVTP